MASFVNASPSCLSEGLTSSRGARRSLFCITPVCKADLPRNQKSNQLSLTKQREAVLHVLEHDLPKQYDNPRQLNWCIYDDDITFDDPVTQLSGKLQYKVR